MTDQPRGDEAQDNVGTGAEISTENNAPANLHDGPDGAPLSDNVGTGAEISNENDADDEAYALSSWRC